MQKKVTSPGGALEAAVKGAADCSHETGMTLPRRALMALLPICGFSLVVYGLAKPVLDEPSLVLGLPSDIGRIDGNQTKQITFRIVNFRPSVLELDSLVGGCSARPLRVTARPLSTVEFAAELDPSRLPVGLNSTQLVLRGFLGDDPVSIVREVRFSVFR